MIGISDAPANNKFQFGDVFMIQQQKLCKSFVEKHQLASAPEIRLLDAISELGELSKELLKSSHYGRAPCVPKSEIVGEMGDCLFALLCLCNSLEIDAHDLLQNALGKYETRFVTQGEISSGR